MSDTGTQEQVSRKVIAVYLIGGGGAGGDCHELDCLFGDDWPGDVAQDRERAVW